jgi:gluconolactonase
MARFLTGTALCLILGAPARAAEPGLPDTVAPGAKLVEVHADATQFFEGPTWDPGTCKLYFTAFGPPTTRILRLDAPGRVSVFQDKTSGTNGTYRSQDGRLLGAQGESHRIVSYSLADPADIKVHYAGEPLHQPNDICQRPQGDIYFTDPDFAKRTSSAVYRLSPAGELSKIAADLAVPNGIITSNDGRTLYVGDSHRKLWRAYPIAEDGTVGEGREFFNPKIDSDASPDGMSSDERGNLYFTGLGGVWVVSPAGESLGFIPVPQFCSNVTFGGADGKSLYVTCKGMVYQLDMRVRGGQLSDVNGQAAPDAAAKTN